METADSESFSHVHLVLKFQMFISKLYLSILKSLDSLVAF